MPNKELPVQYGGFKRENDFEFHNANGVVSLRTLKVIYEIYDDEVSSSFTIYSALINKKMKVKMIKLQYKCLTGWRCCNNLAGERFGLGSETLPSFRRVIEYCLAR